MKKILCVCSLFVLMFSIFCMSVNAENGKLEMIQNYENGTRFYAPQGYTKYAIIKTNDNKYKNVYITEEQYLIWNAGGSLLIANGTSNMLTKTFNTLENAEKFLYLNSDIQQFDYETEIYVNGTTNYSIVSNNHIHNTDPKIGDNNGVSYYKNWYKKTYGKEPPAALENINQIGSKKIFEMTSIEILGVLGIIISMMISILAIKKGIYFILNQMRGV